MLTDLSRHAEYVSYFNETDPTAYLPKLEASFCRDFSCCGKTLEDLHDLLQHYEEQHVCCEEDPINTAPDWDAEKQPIDFAAMKRRALLSMGDIYASDTFDDDDTLTAFDTNVVRTSASRKRSYNSASSSVYNSPIAATRDVFSFSTPCSTPTSSVPPTPHLRSLSDDGEDVMMGSVMQHGPPTSAEDWMSANETRGESRLAKRVRRSSMAVIQSPGIVLTVNGSEEQPREQHVPATKPYKCGAPGCDKSYKNMNGLKYHRVHGACNQNAMTQQAAAANAPAASPSDCPVASGKSSPSPLPHPEPIVDTERPYGCDVCCKKYKNLNGLKYHKTHAHRSISRQSTPSVERVGIC
ncbi:Zinc finger protein sfp1 [Neolecta irregularis DAH-3]|uniref:Zinc finger protein sfp1 n=1 Tax=Neolecta irregularis (strain DAH-3) TaxID=1198029 RepID=A0A1U7LK29_NEOID|nr:Zinc finger protein sfp1 [Neolecta irregularis DAH-3]|eukprot:OLL23015.1 Zinc finger protein sfp1 [Neolecta irregularis DAH-3]